MRNPRTVVIAACAIIATVLLAPAAAAHAPASSDEAVVTKLPAKIRLEVGEQARLTLKTNRTTGYTWEATGGRNANDRVVVKVSQGRYTAPAAADDGMVGVPGRTSWVITAVRPGRTEVVVVTRPPGAKNTMTDETVGTLSVTVTADD